MTPYVCGLRRAEWISISRTLMFSLIDLLPPPGPSQQVARALMGVRLSEQVEDLSNDCSCGHLWTERMCLWFDLVWFLLCRHLWAELCRSLRYIMLQPPGRFLSFRCLRCIMSSPSGRMYECRSLRFIRTEPPGLCVCVAVCGVCRISAELWFL